MKKYLHFLIILLIFSSCFSKTTEKVPTTVPSQNGPNIPPIDPPSPPPPPNTNPTNPEIPEALNIIPSINNIDQCTLIEKSQYLCEGPLQMTLETSRNEKRTIEYLEQIGSAVNKISCTTPCLIIVDRNNTELSYPEMSDGKGILKSIKFNFKGSSSSLSSGYYNSSKQVSLRVSPKRGETNLSSIWYLLSSNTNKPFSTVFINGKSHPDSQTYSGNDLTLLIDEHSSKIYQLAHTLLYKEVADEEEYLAVCLDNDSPELMLVPPSEGSLDEKINVSAYTYDYGEELVKDAHKKNPLLKNYLPIKPTSLEIFNHEVSNNLIEVSSDINLNLKATDAANNSQSLVESYTPKHINLNGDFYKSPFFSFNTNENPEENNFAISNGKTVKIFIGTPKERPQVDFILPPSIEKIIPNQFYFEWILSNKQVFEFHSNTEEALSLEDFTTELNKAFLKSFHDSLTEANPPIPLYAQFFVNEKTKDKVLRFGHRDQNIDLSFHLTIKAPDEFPTLTHFDQDIYAHNFIITNNNNESSSDQTQIGTSFTSIEIAKESWLFINSLNTNNNSGEVYIIKWNDIKDKMKNKIMSLNLKESIKLNLKSENGKGGYGSIIKDAGNFLLITAPSLDNKNLKKLGAFYIISKESLAQELTRIHGNEEKEINIEAFTKVVGQRGGEFFASSITQGTINNKNYYIVGAPGAKDNNISGRVYLIPSTISNTLDSTSSFIKDPKGENTKSQNLYGSSVVYKDNILIIGAPLAEGGHGQITFFDYSTNLAAPKNIGQVTGMDFEQLGSSIFLDHSKQFILTSSKGKLSQGRLYLIDPMNQTLNLFSEGSTENDLNGSSFCSFTYQNRYFYMSNINNKKAVLNEMPRN